MTRATAATGPAGTALTARPAGPDVAVGVLAVALTLAGCSAPPGGSGAPQAAAQLSCDQVFSDVVALQRAGQVGDGYDDLSYAIEALRTGECPAQWDVFADYQSALGMARQYGPEPCVDLEQYIGAEAIQLLREDALCTDAPATEADAAAPPGSAGTPPAAWLPEGAVAWSDGGAYMGQSVQVCGPLAGVGTSDDDVFLNLGLSYPDPGRFTIVVWDIGGVEPVEDGVVVCATGTVSSYEGVSQIQLWSLDGVQLYR